MDTGHKIVKNYCMSEYFKKTNMLDSKAKCSVWLSLHDVEKKKKNSDPH